MAGKDLAVLHVHDNHGESDEHLALHQGIIDWEDFCQALVDIGFDGVFSMESGIPVGLSNEALEDYHRGVKQSIDALTGK